MKRFLVRIIVCLVPTLLSIGVVAWAYNEFDNGRGGFTLGVDLAGGTILVYEVDPTKTTETFKPEALANALKRRIDPADLYNITIRPVPTNPPRVEIVLPTGGAHQERAEQRTWDAVLADAAREYPVKGTDKPYAEVRRGERAALVDAIATAHPDTNRSQIDEWVERKTRRVGGNDRKTLTGDQVEQIKNDIAKQGRLEFRILANSKDDTEAINAAKETVKKASKEDLTRLEVRAEPPPSPKREDGSSLFPVKLTNELDHGYSWVEMGKEQLYQHGLNSAALAADSPHKSQVETALKTGVPFDLGVNLVYVRKITDWSRRTIKDREMGKSLEFFMLVRDPRKGDEITGDYLVSASEGFDKTGRRSIDFRFNSEGGNLFHDVTTRNKPDGGEEGYKRQLAIIFDGQIISAPSLLSPIRTSGQITGEFTQEEVNTIVRLLRAGALPATLKKDPVSENTMGATLGADTIKWGAISVFGAFLAVMVFMVFYYRFAGLVACIALFANLLMTVAFMVVVQAAFTLPGLAGLVLTLGMAVDANVLIYERLREERDRKATLAQALRNGYDRAFPTILDTHLSSIFTAIVLYVVGNDQLKGFGISLTVGLVISLFTSLYMTRTIFEIGLYKGWLKELNFFQGLVNLIHARYWDFMSIRYYWFTGTAILTVLGAMLFIYRADSDPTTGKATVLNIDFTGGVAYTGQLNEPLDLEDLRRQLTDPKDPLPDLSIEQIYVTGEESGRGSRFFTVRTSRRDPKAVLEYISTQLRGKLKQIELNDPKIVVDASGKRATGADLTFTDEQGKTAYASIAQVQRVIGDQFESRRLSRNAFGLEKPEDRSKEDKAQHYSEMKLRMNDPIDPAVLRSILAGVKETFKNSPQPERLEIFDKQLAASTQTRAFTAILASWIAILLYLWFRFGNWTFGAAAVLCLVHDLFFTLGVIAACHYWHAWFGSFLGIQDFKIDLPAVAALLTLVGYSVNDTIVVFDRIREVRGKNPSLTPQMINDSVNQTLTRTILASATVFVVVLVLYAIGGEGVKLFAFVMIVGVFVGTYSSIYIASPLLLIFGEGRVGPGQADRAPVQATTQQR